MNIAFVYDRVNKFGGAERILWALHKIWPKAPLFTSVYDPSGAPWAKDWDIRTSFLQHIPWAKTHHEKFGWLMPLVFESLDLSGFDVIISVTSEAAKGVVTNARQLHVCYLLTPTRYLWSHAGDYLDMVPPPARPFALALQSRLRQWDFIAAQRLDHMIAIGKLVQERCRKYYRRRSEVLYPPMQLHIKRTVLSELGVEGPSLSKQNYFLVVSRLVPYKRIDLAIDVCNKLKAPLVIVGMGSDEKRLKQLSGPTVQFVGQVTDEELLSIYHGAQTLLMPQEEDFGLVALEAQSLGIPVISYRHSGAAETIQDGKTGILFEEQSVASLCEAMRRFQHMKFTKLHDVGFSVDIFKENFRSTIEQLWKTHR